MRQRYDWDKRKLNDKASAIIWEGTGVDESQKPAFDRVTRGIGGTGFPERWLFYKNIVEKVLGGGNPYEELREAMVKLGIKTNSGKGYEQHFGITLQSRAPEPIQGGPAHLLVDISNEILAASSASDLTPAEEEQLFAEARSLLAQQTQTSKESEIMWIPSLRSISELTFGIAISVVAAQPVEAAGYAIGECRVVNDTERKQIFPFYAAGSYLVMFLDGDSYEYLNKKIGGGIKGGKITLVEEAQHGSLELSSDEKEASRGVYYYLPEEGYDGEDRFVVQVEKNGVKVTIHYVMVVISDEDAPIGRCNPEEWKISLLDSKVSFSDLPGAAVAQTTGSQITLDTNAAGYGWYIDYTPYLNEEWLPTSNPLEWQAKPGSEADGKMDLLSVLLHEYGHVLGIEHSADSHDLMATTLQPGVRRLPTTGELQQMADLVAALKDEMGLASASSSTPQQPNTPLPTAPLPASVGLAAFLAARQRLAEPSR